jgi:hypothetical protein
MVDPQLIWQGRAVNRLDSYQFVDGSWLIIAGESGLEKMGWISEEGDMAERLFSP